MTLESRQHWTSAELLERYRGGDEEAATELFERYLSRLTLLARSRLSQRLAARTDPEDVLMSAWRSFFMGARAGRFVLRRSGDLWRLLVSITMHKLYREVRKQTAAKRDVTAEQPLDQQHDAWLAEINREPTPEEVVTMSEELEAVLSQFDGFHQRVLELRLQGESLADIAEQTERSERTVRRALASIRDKLIARRESYAD